MLPYDFPQSNLNLLKPSGMSDEECMGIRAFFNGGMYISYWKPNKEDLDAMNEGKGIWLTIIGPAHPPVWLSTDQPFEETTDI